MLLLSMKSVMDHGFILTMLHTFPELAMCRNFLQRWMYQTRQGRVMYRKILTRVISRNSLLGRTEMNLCLKLIVCFNEYLILFRILTSLLCGSILVFPEIMDCDHSNYDFDLEFQQIEMGDFYIFCNFS